MAPQPRAALQPGGTRRDPAQNNSGSAPRFSHRFHPPRHRKLINRRDRGGSWIERTSCKISTSKSAPATQLTAHIYVPAFCPPASVPYRPPGALGRMARPFPREPAHVRGHSSAKRVPCFVSHASFPPPCSAPPSTLSPRPPPLPPRPTCNR